MNPVRRRALRLAGATLAAPLLSACAPGREPAAGEPQGPFGADATAEAVTAGIDLAGRVAVVTGCTTGLGFETLRVLALRGAYVVGTGRSLARAEEACRRVPGVTSALQLELGDPASVVACAESLRALRVPIDILVLNAGYRGGDGERELVGGVEKHFAVNHLGHFLLVNRVIDRLYFANQGRVVIVASRAAYRDAPEAGILFDDLAMTRDYADATAYGHSKLANALFSLGLARRLRGTRITANALHPGVIDTEIDRHLGRATQALFGLYTAVAGKTVAEGAATSCYVATSPLLGATSGAWFEDCKPFTIGDSHLHDLAMADRLWAVSEELLEHYIVSHGTPDAAELWPGSIGQGRRDAD